jgi:hypothetical protein
MMSEPKTPRPMTATKIPASTGGGEHDEIGRNRDRNADSLQEHDAEYRDQTVRIEELVDAAGEIHWEPPEPEIIIWMADR